MTTPLSPLPHIQLGNVASDISSGVANFATGLSNERRRKTQEALANALANLQISGAQQSQSTISRGQARYDTLGEHPRQSDEPNDLALAEYPDDMLAEVVENRAMAQTQAGNRVLPMTTA